MFSVFSAFRRGVLFGRIGFLRIFDIRLRVFSAFRRGVLFGQRRF